MRVRYGNMATTSGKTAIVLSGGGALGAFEAGVLIALCKHKTFDIVCGTSIGAINAAFAAQGAFDELQQLWGTIASLKIVRFIDTIGRLDAFVNDVEGLRGKPFAALGNFHLINDWFKIGSKKALLALRGVMDPDPIRALLEPVLSINALKSTLIISATNLTNGTSDSFYSFVNASNEDVERFLEFRKPQPNYDLKQVNYVDVVRASAAIPGAFEPVRMNLGDPGVIHDHVDGGVANNTPVNLALAAGATDVTVVFLDPVGNTLPTLPTTNLGQIGLASFAVMQQKILELDMKLAHQSGAKITEIRPLKPIGLSVLEFGNAEGIQAAFQDGLASGEAAVAT
jgi:NTE family protein